VRSALLWGSAINEERQKRLITGMNPACPALG